MKLTEQPLKFCNPRLVPVLVSITAGRFFGTVCQFISPSEGEALMDAMFAGDLRGRFDTLKFSSGSILIAHYQTYQPAKMPDLKSEPEIPQIKYSLSLINKWAKGKLPSQEFLCPFF